MKVQNQDTTFISHCDTTINGQHVVIDTFKTNDTIYVETHTYDTELQMVEKLMDHPDFGKSIVSVLILVFVAYVICKKRRCKMEKK